MKTKVSKSNEKTMAKCKVGSDHRIGDIWFHENGHGYVSFFEVIHLTKKRITFCATGTNIKTAGKKNGFGKSILAPYPDYDRAKYPQYFLKDGSRVDLPHQSSKPFTKALNGTDTIHIQYTGIIERLIEPRKFEYTAYPF